MDQRLSSLLVVSPLKGDGKTSVATNLAVAYARAGKQVILVDADLRSPQAGIRMGAPLAPGLSEVISGSCAIEDALTEIEPFGSNLRVLPGGSIPPNPSEMLGSARMSAVLAELCEMSDLVLIDSAPVLVVSDAFPLFDQVAGIVGVARLEQTPREAISRGMQVIASAGGRVLGMVSTGGRQAADSYGYGYGETRQPSRRRPAPARGIGRAPGRQRRDAARQAALPVRLSCPRFRSSRASPAAGSSTASARRNVGPAVPAGVSASAMRALRSAALSPGRAP